MVNSEKPKSRKNVFRLIMKIQYVFIGVLLMSILGACSVDCSKQEGQYDDGFNSGKLLRIVGTSASCDEWAEEMGMSTPTDCFCEGFNDGKAGRDNKYENN